MSLVRKSNQTKNNKIVLLLPLCTRCNTLCEIQITNRHWIFCLKSFISLLPYISLFNTKKFKILDFQPCTSCCHDHTLSFNHIFFTSFLYCFNRHYLSVLYNNRVSKVLTFQSKLTSLFSINAHNDTYPHTLYFCSCCAHPGTAYRCVFSQPESSSTKHSCSPAVKYYS